MTDYDFRTLHAPILYVIPFSFRSIFRNRNFSPQLVDVSPISNVKPSQAKKKQQQDVEMIFNDWYGYDFLTIFFSFIIISKTYISDFNTHRWIACRKWKKSVRSSANNEREKKRILSSNNGLNWIACDLLMALFFFVFIHQVKSYTKIVLVSYIWLCVGNWTQKKSSFFIFCSIHFIVVEILSKDFRFLYKQKRSPRPWIEKHKHWNLG